MAHENQWLEAASHWQQTLKLNPSHLEAQKALAQAKQKLGKSDETYDRGVQYYLTGQYPEALKEWKKVLARDPNRPHLAEYIEKANRMQLQQEVTQLKSEKPSTDDNVEMLSQQAYTLY